MATEDKLKQPTSGPAPAHAHDPAPAPQLVLPRIMPLPDRVEIDEQIVGSEHVFPIAKLAMLMNAGVDGFVSAEVLPSRIGQSPFSKQLGLDPGPTLAATSSAFMIEEDVPRPNVLGRDSHPIRLRFSPTAAGLYTADVMISVVWRDGSTEKHRITVVARAREVDQLPDKAIPDPEPRVIEGLGHLRDLPRKSLDGVSHDALDEFETAVSDASQAAGSLAREQDKGVHNAEEQAKSYQKAPPESPWWAELIELAISMGIAGVAGAVAKNLGPKLAKLVQKSSSKDSPLGIGTTDGLKDGLKNVGKSLTARVRAGQNSTGELHGSEFSSNARIEFFAQQSSLLSKAENMNADVIKEQKVALKRLLASDPREAIEAMRAIASSLHEARDDSAIQIQQTASERQWVAAVARSNLGAERVYDPTDGKHRTTSNMAGLRYGRGKRTGVLTLELKLPMDFDTSQVTLTRASITGLSQEIADRLHGTPLLSAGIPVLLVVRGVMNTAWITRDEAGRIRITGFLPHDQARDHLGEAQMHHAAAELCERVLGRSLKDWGLAEITSDDATGRGD